jgi:hypothetical protein
MGLQRQHTGIWRCLDMEEKLKGLRYSYFPERNVSHNEIPSLRPCNRSHKAKKSHSARALLCKGLLGFYIKFQVNHTAKSVETLKNRL